MICSIRRGQTVFLVARLLPSASLALLTLAGAVRAQGFRLNGPLIPLGGVYGHKVSPDGEWCVYQADAEVWHLYELYRVSLHGRPQPVKISPPLLQNQSVVLGGYDVTPSRLVYGLRNGTVAQLYSKPLVGGAAVRLNGPLVTGGSVQDHWITPDFARVIYYADQNTNNRFELYSAPVDGSRPALNRNGPITGGMIRKFPPLISADSQRFVYIADHAVSGVDEVYSVPIDGSSLPVKLNPPLVAGGDVADFFVYAWNGPEISPDSTTLVYRADQDEDEVNELYSVPLDGSAPALQLNAALVPGGDVVQVHISPDSSRVVYTADQATDGAVELYSVPLAGGSPPIRLNPAYPVGRGASLIGIAPDSSRVVYLADQDTAGRVELYSVAIDGSSAPVKLHGPVTPGGDVPQEAPAL